MSAEWYYLKGEKRFGPVSPQQLGQLAMSGQLLPDDFVWNEGLADWMEAKRVSSLRFPAAPARAPMPVQKPPMGLAAGGSPSLGIPAMSQVAIPISSPVSTQQAYPYAAAGSGYTTSRRSAQSLTWSLVTCVGALVVAGSFFVPWWSMTCNWNVPNANASPTALFRAQAAFSVNQVFMVEHNIDDFFSGRAFMSNEMERTLWGWDCRTGFLALGVGLITFPLIVVFGVVRTLRPWIWIVYFAGAVCGFVMLIMFLVWFFGVPSQNFEPYLQQGLVVGPYMILLGGLGLVVAGLSGGIVGVQCFARTHVHYQQVYA